MYICASRDICPCCTGLHGMSSNDIEVIASYLSNYKEQLPIAFWKDVSSQHFKHEHGAYMGKADLKAGCAPLANMNTSQEHFHYSSANWFNNVSLPILRKANITIIRDEAKTYSLWNYHQKGECTHFCHPSAPQIWVHSLYASLVEHQHDLR